MNVDFDPKKSMKTLHGININEGERWTGKTVPLSNKHGPKYIKHAMCPYYSKLIIIMHIRLYKYYSLVVRLYFDMVSISLLTWAHAFLSAILSLLLGIQNPHNPESNQTILKIMTRNICI